MVLVSSYEYKLVLDKYKKTKSTNDWSLMVFCYVEVYEALNQFMITSRRL